MEKVEIMVVEDDPELLKRLSNEFQSLGARVLTAANDTDAIEIFRKRASSISAVVTDMRLRSEDYNDHSGGMLAQNIQEIEPRLPIFCNSAIDVSGDFDCFRRYFFKAGPRGTHISDHFGEIFASASEFDRGRYSDVPRELLRLKEKYRISDADFVELIGSRRIEEMRSTALLLFHRAVEHSADPDNGAVPVYPDPSSGASIIIIEPADSRVRNVPLVRAAPVVVSYSDEQYIAELFGFPLVYTYAETLDRAIEYLIDTLWQDYRDVYSKTQELNMASSSDMVRFGIFLKLLFEQRLS